MGQIQNLLETIRHWSPLAAAVLVLIVAVMQIRFAKRTSAKQILDGVTAGLEWLKEIDDKRLATLERKLGRAFKEVDTSIGTLRKSVGDSVAQAAREIGELRESLGDTYRRMDVLAKQAQDSERWLASITDTLDGVKTILARSRRLTRFMMTFILVGLGGMVYSVPKVMAEDVGLGAVVVISDGVMALVALAGFLNVSLAQESAAAKEL